MFQIVPNSGIMGSDYLDDMRSKAILSARDSPIPEPVAEYIRTLERMYMTTEAERKRRAQEEIGWPTINPEY